MKIAIDAMGGDNAPEAVVQGAVEAAREWKDIEILLVGDQALIEKAYKQKLKGASGGQVSVLPSNLQIIHAEEVITADDEPVKAVRRKKDASMVVAGRLVKEKQADAMISAGNTGALMATGLLIIGRIPGIERPALAPMLPTLTGTGVLALDLGANMDAAPEHLVQYARMGSIYRHKVEGMKHPRVGLLNVGTEHAKGNELTKAAFPLLEQAEINFIGNVEAREVLQANCDVLICDGFAGNILLKSMEGVGSSILGKLKEEFTKSWINKLAAAVLAPGLKKFKKMLDYKEYGGALLLGIQGVCIKSHGSSNAYVIKQAVKQARSSLQGELLETIANEFNKK